MWVPLAAEREVLVPDLPGSGFSTKPAGRAAYRIAALADTVEALLGRYGIEHCELWCHAYASSVGQELLARDRERRPLIERAVFINGGLFAAATRCTRMQRLLLSPLGPLLVRLAPGARASFYRRLTRQFGAGRPPSPDLLAEAWQVFSHGGGQRRAPAVMGYLRERRRRDRRWTGALLGARCPVGLVIGRGDALVGPATLARWRDLLPAAPVVELPEDIGHYPPLEAPRETLAACRGLSARLAEAGSALL